MSDTVPVPSKSIFKSKIFWCGLVLILKFVLDRIGAPGWAWDEPHISSLLSGGLGAAIALMRAFMPDVVTGLALFDSNNPVPQSSVGAKTP